MLLLLSSFRGFIGANQPSKPREAQLLDVAAALRLAPGNCLETCAGVAGATESDMMFIVSEVLRLQLNQKWRRALQREAALPTVRCFQHKDCGSDI